MQSTPSRVMGEKYGGKISSSNINENLNMLIQSSQNSKNNNSKNK